MILLMEKAPGARRPRPYWHVDAKWIAGILLFFSLGACLLFYNLATLTERNQAVNLSTSLAASLFSQNSLGSSSGLDELRQLAAQSKTATISPIPELPNLKIPTQDVLTLNPADLRAAILSRISGSIYDLGVEAAAAQLVANPDQRQQFTNQAGSLGLLTKSTHDLFRGLWLAAALLSLILLGLVIYFSAGWGRLLSPGVVLLAVSPIGSLLGLGLLYAPSGQTVLQSVIPPSLAPMLGTSLSHSYGYAFVLGIVLVVAAFFGKVVSVVVKQNHNTLVKPIN